MASSNQSSTLRIENSALAIDALVSQIARMAKDRLPTGWSITVTGPDGIEAVMGRRAETFLCDRRGDQNSTLMPPPPAGHSPGKSASK